MMSIGPRIRRRLHKLKKSAAKEVARAVYSIPALSSGDPRRRITTIEKYCPPVSRIPLESDPTIPRWRLPIIAPEMVHRQPALSLDETEAAKFREGALRYQGGEHFELPEVSLACLNNARVYSEDFLVLSPDNQILFESAVSRMELLEVNGILDRITWPVPTRSHGPACLLAQNSPRAYYHWLIEVLPRFVLLERFPELNTVPLILCERLAQFQVESLQILGVRPDRIISFDDGCWQFERLYFPMLLGPTGCPSPLAVRWLRERFLKPTNPARHGPKRIYLTRRDASQRRVLNEEQIVTFLQSHGFEVICPGELSLSQQIELFRDVEIVVAPHGAGATNMVFAPPGAMLVELFGDNYINGCFWALANICGHRYRFVTGPSQHLDYSVPVDRLDALLTFDLAA